MFKQNLIQITHKNTFFRYSEQKFSTEGKKYYNFCEMLYIKGGKNTTFISEDFYKPLHSKTLVLIPKKDFYFWHSAPTANNARLIINFMNIPGFDDIISDIFKSLTFITEIKPHISHILERMCLLLQTKADSPYVETALYGYLQSLLSELLISKTASTDPQYFNHDTLITECIHYINENFTNKFTIEAMASELNCSVSGLSQKFKNSMGVTIHQFVTEKRLLYAQKLLSENRLATKIYTDCGFNDYTTFYKAYRKRFGEAPTNNDV